MSERSMIAFSFFSPKLNLSTLKGNLLMCAGKPASKRIVTSGGGIIHLVSLY